MNSPRAAEQQTATRTEEFTSTRKQTAGLGRDDVKKTAQVKSFEDNEHFTIESVFTSEVSLSALLNIFCPDPFNITYPTAVQASLPSQCSLARFDRSGRFVAAGRSDGSAAIWDLETRAAVRWLEGHVKGITSVECVMCSPSGVL